MRKRILLIDDKSSEWRLLYENLQDGKDFELHWVYSLHQALILLDSAPDKYFDLVISDYFGTSILNDTNRRLREINKSNSCEKLVISSSIALNPEELGFTFVLKDDLALWVKKNILN